MSETKKEVEVERKRIAVYAHSRSGTAYMSELLYQFGLDVSHESDMGADGVSSFLMGAVENPRWGPDPQAYSFDIRIHLTRHPITVVSSVMACVTEPMQEYMARVCGVDTATDPLKRAVLVYLAWHKRILHCKPTHTMQVENAIAELTRILETEPKHADSVPVDLNSREEVTGAPICLPDLTLKDFRDNLPLGVLYHFTDLITKYGYKL